ncbi:ZSWM7 protein, partial [Pomatorhinus ruficollis]|nr:ZSWM7 protein [Pomatorhinus ruficollis]
MDRSTLPAVAEELLREIKKAFQETSQGIDMFSSRLKFIFGPSAVPALDLVDQRSVTRVRAPSGRTLYQVHASLCSCFLMVSSWHLRQC